MIPKIVKNWTLEVFNTLSHIYSITNTKNFKKVISQE
jgi:hypothetical protein